MNTLLIATRNPGKAREIEQILKDLPFKLKTVNDIGFVEEIDETGTSFEENATLKAKKVGEKTHLLTLAEDSGLEVDALLGKPGIYSARYVEGTDKDRVHRILEELEGIPREKRKARFKTIVALYNPNKKKTYLFMGESRGYITEKPIGKNGFGYDPIFFNIDLGKTNGKATPNEKNRVSHRARALEKCKLFLCDYKNS